MENNLYSLEQKRYERKNEEKRNRSPFLLVFLPILLVTVILLLFNNNRIDLTLAKYGQIVDGFTTEGLLVRDEEVFTSPVAGAVSLRQEEGERISYGQEVLQVDQSILYNHRAGIISYATDGLETRLSPERLNKLSFQEIDSLKRNYRQLVEGRYLKPEQPAFRIVDNRSLYLIIKTTAREANRYRENELVFIRPGELKRGLVEGQIKRLTTDETRGLIIVELNQFIREWLNLRQVEVEFIKNFYQGIVIPRGAVFTSPEGEGVLLSGAAGAYKFQPVKVLDGNEKKVVVDGLKIGDNIIENPAAVDYGKGVE